LRPTGGEVLPIRTFRKDFFPLIYENQGNILTSGEREDLFSRAHEGDMNMSRDSMISKCVMDPELEFNFSNAKN